MNSQPKKDRSAQVPVLVNMVLMLALAVFAYFHTTSRTGGAPHGDETGLEFFFLLVGLLYLNGLALLLAIILRKWHWLKSLLLGGLFVGLVGLGTCGYNISQ